MTEAINPLIMEIVISILLSNVNYICANLGDIVPFPTGLRIFLYILLLRFFFSDKRIMQSDCNTPIQIEIPDHQRETNFNMIIVV